MMPGGTRFVANDTTLDAEGQRLLIITGPNMSGKSVYIRQVALITLMAQIGSFVPARSARLGLVDRIFVRAGATDDIAQGRSTFMVEMNETAYILHHATPRSLVVLDEVGRGTSTYDGMALAWAVGEDLHNRITARTLFATHFHELTALGDELKGARNASLAAKEQGHEVVFLYRLIQQGADRSYGVQVARLAGIPDHVIERARQVMARLEGLPGLHEMEDVGYTISNATKTSEVHPESHPQPGGESDEQTTRDLQQIRPPYLADHNLSSLLVPADDESVWMVVRRLFGLDIANLTPVQALVVLNELQQQLRGWD
jgi:DNA mismatch repair ATPase MutS